MATQIGTAHVFGLGTFVINVTGIGSHPGANTTGATLTHENDVDRIKGTTGEYTGVISSGDSLSCEFNLIPEATTLANSLKSASLPAAPTGVTITGMQIVACGPFSDAFNTNAGNTQPWIYEGGGRLVVSNSEKWMLTLPLKRYIGITSATAVT